MKKDVYIYERSFNEKRIRIIANMSHKERKINITKTPVISNYNDFNGKVLRPYEALIIEV